MYMQFPKSLQGSKLTIFRRPVVSPDSALFLIPFYMELPCLKVQFIEFDIFLLCFQSWLKTSKCQLG